MLATAGDSQALSPPAAEASLRSAGLIHPGKVHVNLSPAALVELALARGEGLLSDQGSLVAYTGAYTGRSPRDRYLVLDPASQDAIDWGKLNQPLEPAVFDRLFDKVQAYFQGRDLFVCDGWACADPRYRVPVRIIAEKAWHALFMRCLLLLPRAEELAGWAPRLTIVNACGLRADPTADGTRSEVFIVLHLERGLVLIGGTQYAGEIKKAVFSVLNYLLPQRGVFPMHCSANIGPAGDTALFFGLSGTGKTTLSADPRRRLIGDDEHGWSDEGVFNIEGGCYAKTHPPVAERRAADLGRDPLRQRAGKRRPRPGDAPARLRRRALHREHARRLSGGLHRQLPSRPAGAATRATCCS